jgi:hypothetical protein
VGMAGVAESIGARATTTAAFTVVAITAASVPPASTADSAAGSGAVSGPNLTLGTREVGPLASGRNFASIAEAHRS